MYQVHQPIGEMPPDQLGDLGHRPQPAVGGTPEPTGKEVLGRPPAGVVSELAEVFFDSPGLIPTDAQQASGPLDPTLAEQVNDQAFEPSGELVAGFRSSDRDLFGPMGGDSSPEAPRLGSRW